MACIDGFQCIREINCLKPLNPDGKQGSVVQDMILNENGGELLKRKIFLWIDRLAILDYLEMHVASCTSAGTTHRSNNLTFFDLFTDIDQIFVVMGISRYITISMAYFD